MRERAMFIEPAPRTDANSPMYESDVAAFRLAFSTVNDAVTFGRKVAEPAMITSSPCCQFTGVATLCLAVSWRESITRSTSSKLRPVVIG